MSQTTLDIFPIPDDQYFDFMCEIYALPVRKQAKWRGFLQDTNGVKHRVHFVNDELVFKHKSTWITAKPTSDEYLNRIVDYENPNGKDQHQRMARAYKSGGIVAAQQEHDRMVEEAATGNHRSKLHKIRVPTKAGEPVRA